MTVNSSVETIPSTSPAFRLKGGLFPLTLLEITHGDPAGLRENLARKVAEAPSFFKQAPTILSLEYLQEGSPNLNLSETLDLCREFGLAVVAIRDVGEFCPDEAQKLNLAIMPATSSRKAGSNKPAQQTVSEASETSSEAPAEKAEEPTVPATIKPATTPTKIITTPVRSGQQIYSEGDLIVLAPVSAGAEILADGNIHVYGPARGRILAGVKGNQQARIFCQSLEAELISIAGFFKVNEDLREKHWKQSVQVYLTDESLNIRQLG